MASGLKRHQRTGHLHFLTFSCYRRQAYLGVPAARDLFEYALERTRRGYRFQVIGYVVMPEHVHLLVSEPEKKALALGIQSLKLSVVRRSKQNPFWQARYYDFNVFSEAKRIEKLEYMHANPIKRGLVDAAEDWRWSSYRSYRTREEGPVRIEPLGTMHWKPA
jgi:putative transposase